MWVVASRQVNLLLLLQRLQLLSQLLQLHHLLKRKNLEWPLNLGSSLKHP
jgi:hypothetical protein